MDSHLERLQQELEKALAAATPAAMSTAPSGKWTPVQILEHLYLTYEGTNRGLSKCLETGAPLATRATFKNRLQTFAVVTLQYFPSGRKSPERATPRGMPSDELLRVIFPEIRQMGSSLAECQRRFGARTKILDHPILGPLTSREWSKFHLVHGLHHVRQLRERTIRD